MKNINLTLIIIFTLGLSCAGRPWQHLNDTGVTDLAANFQSPPVEYSMTFYWGWDGGITEEVISRDLDAFRERGVHIVTLEPGYDMGSPYLSDGWFKLVKKTVELARERNMRVWIVDEGKYPSGFAGGKFTEDAPELRMKALVIAEQFEIAEGQSITRPVSDDVVSAVAVNLSDSTNQVLDLESGELHWKVPEGRWQVFLVKHDFRSSPTRAVNNPTRGKDPSNSLCDYLDPAATRQFIEFTHEQHKQYIGSEFGKTVLGFRGDEPDYSIRGIPWTPRIFTEFERRKRYDVKPLIATFFTPRLTEKQRRIYADYWDVWSDLFAENFFKPQADWCARHHLEYLVHLNQEDRMTGLVRTEGDFFKCMRSVQMPGVDAIWNQIWPGKVADYPKYASSAAHLYGRPRAFTESFAAYRIRPTVEQAKWVLDYQFVRGINMVEVMFVPASSGGRLGLSGWNASRQFPAIASYIHRVSYLLSQGRPAAQIGLYTPTSSMWLGDIEADHEVLRIAQHLLESQCDFDFMDEQALSSLLISEGGVFKNLSGQGYTTVIIPPVRVISKTALKRLQSFSNKGGRVIFLGSAPALVIDNTFLNADGLVDISWAVHEPSGELTSQVIEAFPEPDIRMNQPRPTVKGIHRRLRDADLYFFFNEDLETQFCEVDLKGNGEAQSWNAMTGTIEIIDSEPLNSGMVRVKLELKPYATQCIVVGQVPSEVILK
jgi:hypothetical protein